MYKIELRNKVLKLINSFDTKTKNVFFKKEKELEKNPYPKNKKHILRTTSKGLLCELSLFRKNPIRFYYLIIENKVIIEKIVFENKSVYVIDYTKKKSSSKKGTSIQQRKINKLKKIK